MTDRDEAHMQREEAWESFCDEHDEAAKEYAWDGAVATRDIVDMLAECLSGAQNAFERQLLLDAIATADEEAIRNALNDAIRPRIESSPVYQMLYEKYLDARKEP